MTQATNTISPAFGYLTSNTTPEISSGRMKRNIHRVLGYLPVIGTIVGIARIIIVSKIFSVDPTFISKRTLSRSKWHVVRGAIESLSCGALLIIPDIVVTAIKYLKYLDNCLSEYFDGK